MRDHDLKRRVCGEIKNKYACLNAKRKWRSLVWNKLIRNIGTTLRDRSSHPKNIKNQGSSLAVTDILASTIVGTGSEEPWSFSAEAAIFFFLQSRIDLMMNRIVNGIGVMIATATGATVNRMKKFNQSFHVVISGEGDSYWLSDRRLAGGAKIWEERSIFLYFGLRFRSRSQLRPGTAVSGGTPLSIHTHNRAREVPCQR